MSSNPLLPNPSWDPMNGTSGSGFTPAGSSSAAEANQQITADVDQWIEDQYTLSQEFTGIQTALAQMEAEMKSGDPQAAFMAIMMAFTQIFPAIFQYKEQNMTVLGDSENIASDLRTFVNNIQNGINNESGSSSADVYDNTMYLAGWSNYLDSAQTVAVPNVTGASISWNPSPTGSEVLSPLDPNDGTNIINSCSSVAEAFGTNGSDWGNTTAMGTDIANWWTTNTTNGPNPELKNVQAALQTANSSVSTLSTTTQTNEQFYTNEFNQLVGIDNSMQQNFIEEISNMVSNIRSANS